MAQNNGRGFADMDPDRQREIASMGGRAAHERGAAHEWDSQEAADAGRMHSRAAYHHGSAAFHHESAAHHHRQAATHRANGRHSDADLHANTAEMHSRAAQEHSERADHYGRGFAGVDPDRQREISSMGGRASHGGASSESRDSYDRDRDGGRGRDDGWRDRDDRSNRGREYGNRPS